jgi:ribosomal protein L40E
VSPQTAYSILALILVLVFAATTAKVASDKGASPALWFVAGALLPGIALIVALFLEEYRSFKTCPNCARRVNPDARVCRSCGYELITHFRSVL